MSNPPTFKNPGFPKPGQPGPGKPTLPAPMGGFPGNPVQTNPTGPTMGGPTGFGAGPKPTGPNGAHMGGPPSGSMGFVKSSQSNFEGPPKPVPGGSFGRGPVPGGDTMKFAPPKMGQMGMGQVTGSTTSLPAEKFNGDVSQLPEEFHPVYDSVMRGMDLLDQIDVRFGF